MKRGTPTLEPVRDHIGAVSRRLSVRRHRGREAKVVALSQTDDADIADVWDAYTSPGTRRLYNVHCEPLQEVDAWLERFRGFWTQRLDALGTEIARGKRLQS